MILPCRLEAKMMKIFGQMVRVQCIAGLGSGCRKKVLWRTQKSF